MREGVDEANRLATLAEIEMAIEDRIGVTFDDTELCARHRTITLRDIADFVRGYLSPTPDAGQVAVQLVLEAAWELARADSARHGYEPLVITDLSLDKPLLDAMYPDKWERAYPSAS